MKRNILDTRIGGLVLYLVLALQVAAMIATVAPNLTGRILGGQAEQVGGRLEAGSYQLNTTAPQDAILDRARIDYNGTECSRLALPTNCTLAQATAKDANTTYCNTIMAYLVQSVKDQIASQKAKQTADDSTTWQQYWSALSASQKAANCAAMTPPPSVCLP